MDNNIRVTVDGIELPIIDGKVTFNSTPVELHHSAHDWNAAIQRMQEPTTITWTLHPEEPYQPTGPIVEGSIEPLQG
jgi:hypothetical protein